MSSLADPASTYRRLMLELQELSRESGPLTELQSDSSVCRMRALHRLQSVLETLWALDLTDWGSRVNRPSREWAGQCFYTLLLIRRVVEDARVQLHPELSVTVFDPDFGLTEDVCYFLVWSMCTWLCRGCRWCVGQDADDRLMDVDARLLLDRGYAQYDTAVEGYMWTGIGVSQLSPVQLDYAFASLFTHSRHLDWQARLLPALTVALQMRASELLFRRGYLTDLSSETAEEKLAWCERRVLWSCGTARLKLAQLSMINWKCHVHRRLAQVEQVCFPKEPVTSVQFRNFLESTVHSWIGPRLRESLAKANNRRLLRPDEIGRNAAFDGNNRFCRARGGMDAMENAMHNLDVVKLISCPEDELLLACLGLRELLMLRIMHNALETSTSCDLMGRHVVLQSVRDSRSSRSGSDVNLFVHKIVELPGGFVVTPHQEHYPQTPMILENALLHWYNTHFECSDPLGMSDILLNYITGEDADQPTA